MADILSPALFEGAPVFHLPKRLGFTVSKPILYRIPVTGSRPISLQVSGLPDGLSLDGAILSGTPDACGCYTVTVRAQNADGRSEITVPIEIGEDLRLISPLLGFTSWNAFRMDVSQERMETTGRLLSDTGLADVGYAYLNIDSGWQYCDRAPDGTIRPNPKFPDMHGFCSRMHALGLKCGLYSTPMLEAWGCPTEYPSIPGCTAGDPDPRFADTNGGIGMIHLERENARNWADWGFDYLKYDWSLVDTVNCELMRRALRETDRDFAMSVTVYALREYAFYWKRFINSYRQGPDSEDNFQNVKWCFESTNGWTDAIVPGHFFDMDMLEIGTSDGNGGPCRLSEDEQIFAMTMRYIFNSPIQISCDLSKLSEFELALYANFEALEINQDVTEPPCRETLSNGLVKVSRHLSDGSLTLGIFNLSDLSVSYPIPVETGSTVRNVWTGEEFENKADANDELPAHACRFFRIRN